MQGLDAIVWEADADTLEFSFVNERAEEVLGYPVERWLSEPGFFASILHPGDREPVLEHCVAETRARRDHEANFRLLAADGRILWFHEFVRVIRGDDRPACVRGVMVEMTSRREADRFIRFQAQLLEEINAAVIATDPRGIVTYWNRHAEELLGWRREETLGLGVEELYVRPEDAVAAERRRRRALDGESFRGEVTYRRKDGRAVPVFSRFSAIRDGHGAITGLIAIADDLTDRKRVDEQIRFQASLLDALDAAVIATDVDLVVKHWNHKAEELHGWTAEEALGRNAAELVVPPEEIERVQPVVARLRAGESLEREVEVQRKDGSRVQVWVKTSPVLDEGGMPVGWVGLSVEVSKRDRIPGGDGNPARSAVLRAALDAIVTIDERGLVTYFNPAAERIFGYTTEEAEGRELAELVIPTRFRERHREGLRRAVAGGESKILDQRIEAVALRADGSEFPVELAVTRMESGETPRFVGFVRDISERLRAERHVAELGDRDPLTGVASLRFLRARLAEALTRADREGVTVALMHVDLRRFSLVNASLGRTRGDALLRDAAARLLQLEPAPAAVAREGGDEFWIVAILEANSGDDRWRAAAREQAEEMGKAVHHCLAGTFEVGDAQVSLQADIGTSVYPMDAFNPETMLEHAEVATRDAQRIPGRTTVLFSGHTSDPREELSLMTELSGALARNEFVLHYQPLVDLARVREAGVVGATIGVEALIRWQHPKQGLLPPARFLGLLEDAGLMAGVGNWVVDELCRQLAAWREHGVEIGGAFNLSPRELWQPDLAERIAAAASSHGLTPDVLTVEITESAAMVDPETSWRVLGRLREEGFHLAIDDFGTGHSSLGRVRDLPADMLKIDRSFINDVAEDRHTQVIVEAILGAARGLGLRTLAEGIETDAELDFMLERRCERGQGYLFGRPAPAADLQLEL